MGALAGDVCTISDDTLRQMEDRVVAKVEKAMAASPKSVVGNFFLGMLQNLLVVWLVSITCMVSRIVGFKKALCKIKLFKYFNDLHKDGGSSAGADTHELATTVAGVPAGLNGEIQLMEEEMSSRRSMTQLLSNHHDGRMVPTDMSSTTVLHTHLPNATLTENPKVEQLRSQTIKILNLPDTQNLTVAAGSIFLSATVSILKMDDLLCRATRLLKMGSGFDPACTVQLGASALLYTTSDESVATLLLEQGVYDVPIITSVQRFHTKTIMIKGFYLKDTEIKASISSEKSVSLSVLYYQELDKGLEVLFSQLPQDELLCEKTLIYANKSIHIEGYANPLVLRSLAKEIDIYKNQSSLLGTLRRRKIWMILSLQCVYGVMVLKPWHMPRMEWVFPVITLFFSVLLVEYIISPWTFHIITRCLQYMMESTNLDNILVLNEISKRRNMATATNTRFYLI